MKLNRLMFATALCTLFINAAAPAQSLSKWTGSYEYTASLGRTAGGTAINITYEVTIRPDGSAVIQATGYQTDDEIRCDTRVQGNRISLYFKSYPDGGNLNQFGVQLYQKGDFLLSLERVSDRQFRVRWGKYNTELKRSVLFKKQA